MIKRVENLWLVVAVDPEDNTEGVVAETLGNLMMPLIAADEDRLPHIIRQGKKAAAISHPDKVVKLIRLSVREEVEILSEVH